MPIFRRSDLSRYWPNADSKWPTAFLDLHEQYGERYGITTMQRWRHFLAQCSAETSGLICTGKGGMCLPGMVENLNYRPASLLKANGYRVRKAQRDIPRFQKMSLEDVAEALCADHQLLAEICYGKRKELGNVNPGDGWKYIGRGPLQTTGRDAYEMVSKLLNIDCVGRPELLQEPRYGWEATFAEWHHLGCNELADQGNVDKVSRRVNGGDNGLAERRAWLKKAEAIWPDDDVPHLVAPRDEATAADVIDMGSRSASAAKTVQTVGTAVAAAGAVGTIADQAKTVTDNIDALKGVGDAIHSVIEFAKVHALIALILGGLVVAYFGSRILSLAVENFRHGRYEPSGR